MSYPPLKLELGLERKRMRRLLLWASLIEAAGLIPILISWICSAKH